ncbi:MAG TPA: VOC family protein [bacterium]|nr:VOC family protein [bacterium]
MSRVVHFEIMAKEPQKAIDFYSAVLDWKFQKSENTDSEYWRVSTGDEQRPGINGGLAAGDPVGAVINTIGIADLDATLGKIEEHGGKVVQPRVARPGMGWFASFEDPTGNQMGLMQADAAAQ